MILPQGKRVPLVVKAPEGVVAQPSVLNGSFTWREEFKDETLSLEWIMLRAPSQQWWKVDPAAGKLELTPRSDTLSGRGNPSYLGRRVRHAVYAASLTADIPTDEGVSSGLALFFNDQHHFFLAVQRDGDKARVYLERVNRGRASREAVAELASGGEIELRVEAHKTTCSFKYRLKGGDWQTLVADTDATMLSYTVPDGLFLGATVGPHVRVDQ